MLVSKNDITPFHPLSHYNLPMFLTPVRAGFPSPADDFLETHLDLNEFLVKHPSATFFIRVRGDAMEKAGIFSGDMLIVDRSLEPYDGSIIIATVNGELMVKRMRIFKSHTVLEAENPHHSAIIVTPDIQFEVWGVVTNVIHKVG